MVQLPTTVLIPTNAPQVSVRNQHGPQGTVPLGPNGLSVGREATCDIVLDSQNVSRNHAQISWDGTQAYVTDLGSTNGCRLAGQQLQSSVAHPWPMGMLLQVGDCQLRLEIPGAVSPGTTIMPPLPPAAPTPLPIVQPMPTVLSNSSGLGKQSAFPSDAGGLNFGAFLLTPIWASVHGCWGVFTMALIPGFNLIIPFVALFKGNEWAWRKRTWRDVDDLKRSQRSWAVAGLVSSVILVVLLLVIALIVLISAINSAPYRGHNR